jgi:hypothetical protein
MDRSERHRQIKAINKRIEYLEKHTALKDKAIVRLGDDEKKLLAENNHPDKELQRKFNSIPGLLKELVDLHRLLVGLSPKLQKELP